MSSLLHEEDGKRAAFRSASQTRIIWMNGSKIIKARRLARGDVRGPASDVGCSRVLALRIRLGNLENRSSALGLRAKERLSKPDTVSLGLAKETKDRTLM